MSNSGIKPISISSWQKGIADSPYLGFQEMRGVDVVSHPGAIVAGPKLLPTVPGAVSGTFTANASTDTLTGPDMSYMAGTTMFLGGARAVVFTTTGVLPAGLSLATTYFLIQLTATTYKVATTLANALGSVAIDITDAGTGTHTITSIDPGLFKHFAHDDANNVLYGIDDGQRVWQLQSNGIQWFLITGNVLTSSSGNGLRVFKDYLFAFRSNNLDVYGPLSGSPSWNNTWNGLNGGSGIHRTLVGQDDILYFGDDDGAHNPFIGSVQQKAGTTFDSTNSATYTFNKNALTLPKNKIVTTLDELGVNLMIGTQGKEIYPWDRSSATFGLPIICNETNVNAIRTIGNQLYIAVGNKGNLYVFNGYLVSPFKIFPKHLMVNDYNTVSIGAMDRLGRKLLCTVQTPGNSGIYSVDLYTRAMVMENTVTGNTVGSTNPLSLPSLYSDGTTYWIGWKDIDSSALGTDTSTDSGTFRYSSTSIAYVVTPNIDIGLYNEPRTLQNVELYCDRPMTSQQNLVVSYRTQVSGSYTTLVTFTGNGTDQIFQTPAASISATDVQFKIAINSAATVSPFLQELRII